MPSSPANSSNRKASGATALSRLKVQLKFVDLLIEVADARAPLSSRHQQASQLFGNKPRLIVLSKADLADKKLTNQWLKRLQDERNETAIALSLADERGVKPVLKLILNHRVKLIEQLGERGVLERSIRVCIVGLPNVGKSTLINRLIGRRKVKVANRPGVTKGPQWVKIHPQIELLDTPGILPNFELSQQSALKLSLLNLQASQNMPVEDMAEQGLALLKEQYPHYIAQYLDDGIGLESLASKRSFLTSGGRLDMKRAATTFLSDLRNGKLGAITLD